jgi:hypothetical protein
MNLPWSSRIAMQVCRALPSVHPHLAQDPRFDERGQGWARMFGTESGVVAETWCVQSPGSEFIRAMNCRLRLVFALPASTGTALGAARHTGARMGRPTRATPPEEVLEARLTIVVVVLAGRSVSWAMRASACRDRTVGSHADRTCHHVRDARARALCHPGSGGHGPSEGSGSWASARSGQARLVCPMFGRRGLATRIQRPVVGAEARKEVLAGEDVGCRCETDGGGQRRMSRESRSSWAGRENPVCPRAIRRAAVRLRLSGRPSMGVTGLIVRVVEGAGAVIVRLRRRMAVALASAVGFSEDVADVVLDGVLEWRLGRSHVGAPQIRTSGPGFAR